MVHFTGIKQVVYKSRSLLRLASIAVRTHAEFRSNALASRFFLRQGLEPRPGNFDPASHRAVVERVFAAYQESKSKQQSVSAVYQPGTAWDNDIKARRKDYLQVLTDGDVPALTSLLQDFFRGSGVEGIWEYGYFAEIKPTRRNLSNVLGNITNPNRWLIDWRKWFVNRIIQDYGVWRDRVDKADLRDLSPPLVGNPWGYVINGTLVMPPSLRHSYYASTVRNLISDVKSPVVAEIGGGYGGFAYYLLHSSKNTIYINFDLPEIVLIASYYLMMALPEAKVLLYGEAESITPEQVQNHDIILMPNFCLPELPDKSVDVFLNSRSLAEMPVPVIDEYLEQVGRTTRGYFFHDNSDEATTAPGSGLLEVPASLFTMPQNVFKRIYAVKTPWAGDLSRQKEYLYQRV